MKMCMSNMPPALHDLCTFPYRTSNEDEASGISAGIPAVPHLHGGEVRPELDGGPEPGSRATADTTATYYTGPGAAGTTAVYRYPNTRRRGRSGSTTTRSAPRG